MMKIHFLISNLAFSIFLARVFSIDLAATTSTETSVYRNGELVQKLSPGSHTFQVSITKNDVLSLMSTSSPTVKKYLTLKSTTSGNDIPLTWRHSYQSPSDNSWQTSVHWSPACKWNTTPYNKHTSTMIYSNDDSFNSTISIFRATLADDNTCNKKAVEVSTNVKQFTPSRNIKLRLAANDKLWIFVNGRHVGDILNKLHVYEKTLTLKDGDVIFIKAMGPRGGNGIGGLIASLTDNGKHYVTGTNTGWKIGIITNDDVALTIMKGYNDCTSSWTNGRIVNEGITKVTGFPGNANYVWSSANTHDSSIIGARFVIGKSNRCNNHKKKKMLDLCPCEILPTNEWAKCYYFKDKYTMACGVRECVPKYICSTKRDTGIICMRRQNTQRIIPLKGSTNECTNIPDKSYMYIPYDQTS